MRHCFKILESKPDLALVDIKMPGLSGIELIRAAREAGFGGQFIILTGYSEFEFAKAAVSLGVEEYLLKPVDEEELLGCARKVREELDRQEEENRRRDAGEEAAREDVLRKVLLHMGSREELEEQMAGYGISFGEKSLCAAILADAGDVGADSYMDRAAYFLQDSALYQEKVTMDGRVVMIGCGVDYKSWVKKLSARNERMKAQYGRGLLIAVGNNVGYWYELCYSYKFARSMLEQEFLLGHYDILSIQAIEDIAGNLCIYYHHNSVSVFERAGNLAE